MPAATDTERKPSADSLTKARFRRMCAYAAALAVGTLAAAVTLSAVTEPRTMPSLVVTSKTEVHKDTTITQDLWHHLVQIEWYPDRPVGLARSPADLFNTTVFETCGSNKSKDVFKEPLFYPPAEQSVERPTGSGGVCTTFRKGDPEKKPSPPPTPVPAPPALYYSVVEILQPAQPPIRMTEPEPLPFPLRLYRPQSAKYLGSVWFLHDSPALAPGVTCAEMKAAALDAQLNAEADPLKIGWGLVRRIEQELGQLDREVILIGHADETGDEERNLQLSKRRAEYVRCLVHKAGFSPNSARPIATHGVGEKAPLAAVAAPQLSDQRVTHRDPVNRRVDIFLVRAERTPK